MSWSDDTRCLFCDGKLPLFRKLAQGQFCSKAHQESYWKEQDQLAVEVLHRTHDALQAYKTAAPIESILGPMAVPPPRLVEARASVTQPDSERIPALQGLQLQSASSHAIPPPSATILVVDPVEYEVQWRASKPSREFGNAAGVEFGSLAGIVALGPANASVPLPASIPASLVEIVGERLVVNPPDLLARATPKLTVGGPLALREIVPGGAMAFRRLIQPVAFSIREVRELRRALAPCGDVLERVEQEAFPLAETLFSLAGPSAVDSSVWKRIAYDAAEFPAAALAQPQAQGATRVREELPLESRLLSLAGPLAADVRGPVFDASESVEFPVVSAERPSGFVPVAPLLSLSTPAGLLGLSSGIEARELRAIVAGNATSINPRAAAPSLGLLRMPSASGDSISDLIAHTACAPLLSLSACEPRGGAENPSNRPVSYQAFVAEISLRLPDSAQRRVPVPSFEIRSQASKVFRLDVAEKMQAHAGDVRLRPGFVAAPLQGEAILPQAKLTPISPKYRFDGMPEVHGAILQGEAHSARNLAAGVANFWNHAPRDLKMLLFAVPIALGLAFHPSLPKVSVQAQTDPGAMTGQFKEVLDTQMATLRKSMSERAAVGLDENFRQGLDNWMSHSGSTAEWSFDQAGFVQPGRVALYQPSLGLTDYEFQFLGAIDKGALSWVARAVDFQNYYVVKLVVVKDGPVPQMGIVRYAVINGQPMDRVDTPVTFAARTDSLYRVSMEMQGDRYSLVIQGQMIDSWNEPRLKRGGVGFFTNRGEQSRIGWVQITHQYDMLGRLFAYLAP